MLSIRIEFIVPVLVLLLLGCGIETTTQQPSNGPLENLKPTNPGDGTPQTIDAVEPASKKDDLEKDDLDTAMTESIDVREPGPPEMPQDPESVETESPLKDIPLPTEEEPEPQYVEKQTIDIPRNWTRVSPVGKSEVWIDVSAKQVMVAGVVVVREGGLEMFACPLMTKEHESVIAVNARSYEVHTSLLALGVNPGKPVQWHPDYKPAKGPTIEIDVMWKDEESGEIITRRAQEMVYNFKTKKPMQQKWVFGGSILDKDEETGNVIYYGDGGELICLSNFSTATIDLPVESTDADGDLMYAANPETVPELRTKVYMILKPEIKE